MAWVIIIILGIILIVIIRFTSDVKKQNEQVLSAGGMRNKYSILIAYLKGSQGTILSERASSITIGADNMTGGVRFVVTQTFRTVTVQWKISNIVFGDHVLEWEFDNNLSQEAMWEQIQRDLYNYQMNKMYK